MLSTAVFLFSTLVFQVSRLFTAMQRHALRDLNEGRETFYSTVCNQELPKLW